MTTQLRLVDTEAISPTTPEPARPPARRRRARVRADATSTRRPARWHSEWRLDDKTRRVGQQGIAAARDALARARTTDRDLAEAS
ncbi:MAG TPA: hypothetical protein VFW06_01405 [Acidimicrobiia bacterium]|nr:hypothetical protein [Acidimicrobiia bacterium]